MKGKFDSDKKKKGNSICAIINACKLTYTANYMFFFFK